MPRSVCVHPDHRSTVALSLGRKGFLTQSILAGHLEIALSTVNNFCRGIKVSVAKFEEICDALELDPRVIVQPQEKTEAVSNSSATGEPSLDHFFAYDPFWVGREALTLELTTKLDGACRLMLITGMAGVGKTALAERLSVDLQGSTNQLLRENFDDQEKSTDLASFAARLLENCGQVITPEDRTDPQLLTRRLVLHLQQTPYLILIDSLEQILKGDEKDGWSEFKDNGFVAFFKAVLASDTFQSRFILTSQELPSQIVKIGSRYQNFWHCQSLVGLSEAEQQALFIKTGLSPESAPELLRIGKAYEGHPLALRIIIGEIGSHPFYGNIAAYWQRYGQEIEAVEKAIAEAAEGHTMGADDKWQLDRFTRALRRNVQQRLEQTFERLRQDAKYAYILLCESSVYRCPVPDDWWLSHLEDWQRSQVEQLTALEILCDRYLVEEITEGAQVMLKQHNLIRSVSLAHLKQLTFDA
ncbi:AAA family ATPase [Leptolyngbya cf. ectocarpi LEGE 11479]|uniref:AAA family ATPase n=1 Tax=Leptolyngbya cf. ectocarpi LEGE 11479 TaxID=1828722 RepID=A0A929F8V8_LEPEC|nr:ATP-binding protein [Leptolyngbya ectocarpi]MBE9067537.1 AAA family ATPase [Leptolyngbya cf. ectocarpi LEGE 11479]